MSSHVFLTLDLECDYGTALAQNTYDAAMATNRLVSILESLEVPLTCFLQTELLASQPEAVNSLITADVPVEMHAHSHTHPSRETADLSYEVTESVQRIKDEFGTSPVGFRFPDGSISSSDYYILDNNQVAFSSSVFPSLRPGRFNNLNWPQYPFQHQETSVIELPFTIFSSYFPVPVSLSYLKLIGAPFRKLIYSQPPSIIVFDFHMHDLVTPPSFADLPLLYQGIYARNKSQGFSTLIDFISTLQTKGYSFETLGTLYQGVTNVLN